jgi:hypothetical protein
MKGPYGERLENESVSYVRMTDLKTWHNVLLLRYGALETNEILLRTISKSRGKRKQIHSRVQRTPTSPLVLGWKVCATRKRTPPDGVCIIR